MNATTPIQNLTEISLRNGAQIVVSGNDGILSSEKISGDGNGYVYVAPRTQLQLKTHLEPCTQVYSGGAFAIRNNGTSKFAIKRHFEVYGTIYGTERIDLFYGSNVGNWSMHTGSSPRWLKFRSLTIKENSGLILRSHENQTGWKIEIDADRNIEFEARTFFLSSRFDSMNGRRIRFLTGSTVELNKNSALNSAFTTEYVFIDGSVDFGIVKFAPILRQFHVRDSGKVNVITSEVSLKDFACNGSMSFVNDVMISTDSWSVGPAGKVYFMNTTAHVILQAHTLKIDGVFNPGKLSTGTGWQLLKVGPSGQLTFSTNTSVIVDLLEIDGTVKINGTINLQKRDNSGKSLITIGEGGKFLLDDYSPCVNRSKFSGTSELLALNVTVNGLFHVGKMSLGPGWDNLVVGRKGYVAFIPAGHVKIDRVTINGQFKTDTIAVIKSKNSATEEVETFFVTSSGSVDLNCSPQTEADLVANSSSNSSDIARNHASQLFAKHVKIDGTFVARKLYMGLGWDTFRVGATGSFTVHPIGWFSFDEFVLNGKLTSQSSLEIQGKSSLYLSGIYIGSFGHLKSVVNNTDVLVDEVIVEGRFETGLLSIGRGMNNLKVSGTMSFNHVKEFNINTTIITGTLETKTPFTSSGRFVGESLNVTGVIKNNYQETPQQDGGLTSSVFVVTKVDITGSAYFGSLEMTSTNVKIGGLLSVDYGGALANKGNGRLYCMIFQLFRRCKSLISVLVIIALRCIKYVLIRYCIIYQKVFSIR